MSPVLLSQAIRRVIQDGADDETIDLLREIALERWSVYEILPYGGRRLRLRVTEKHVAETVLDSMQSMGIPAEARYE